MMRPNLVQIARSASPFWGWLLAHPVALINLILAFIAAVFFMYLVTKPIDVLANWSVATSKQSKEGDLPVYYPGGTLEFISRSDKLIPAEGETVRIFDCDATETQPAREIQLDKLTANRPPGAITPKENSIIVPSVLEFNGLPRICRIVFNVCYNDVILWRDHCEAARTNDFIVQEEPITSENLRRELDELKRRQEELEAKQAVYEGSFQRSTVVQQRVIAQAPTPSTTTVVQQPQAPSPSPSATPSPVPVQRPCVVGLLGLCILGAR